MEKSNRPGPTVFTKFIVSTILITALMALTSISISAQVGELRGSVLLQRADGQVVALAEANIDVYRTDAKAKYGTKTDKKGQFVFAGLPYLGTYIVAASHPIADPKWLAGVKAGLDIPVDITLTPGDGKRLTLDEIGAAGGESAEAKAAREELIRKNAEIEAGNKKILANNEVIARTFKAGNDELSAAGAASKAHAPDAIQHYTAAVALYDEGLAADSEQPAIMTNKAVALKGRGVERFNAAVSSKTLDDAGRFAARQMANDDFKAAAEAAGNAVKMIKALPAPSAAGEIATYNSNRYAAMLTYAEAMRLYVSKGAPEQADMGAAAYKDYLGVEADPVKRAKAQLDLAQMLLDSNQFENALAAFRVVLATRPNSPEANLGAGLALYGSGDKAKYEQVATYLRRFVELAPDSDPLKADARAVLSEIEKTEE